MTNSPIINSPKGDETKGIAIKPKRRTTMDAFNKTSYYKAEPAITFGTGTRPPLYTLEGGPGPGAYPIKTTIGKLMESHIKSPCQFSLRGRVKFGDPNEKSMNKNAKNEPGPGQYDLNGKFLGGTNPRKSAFPKGIIPRDKGALGPGPGSYTVMQSMGHQVLSTKEDGMAVGFAKAERKSMVPPGLSEVGPGEYGPFPAACEPQVESKKANPGFIKFGTGYRRGGGLTKKDLSEPSPGPGSYYLPGGVGTKAKGSPFRDSPQATISGRNKFGSPW